MSEVRSISFNKQEEELLKYFDNNGRSDLVKKALKSYKDEKDENEIVLTDEIKEKILEYVKEINQEG